MSNVYTIEDFKMKLFSLGLDFDTVTILIEDVQGLLDYEFEDGVRSKQAEEYWSNSRLEM